MVFPVMMQARSLMPIIRRRYSRTIRRRDLTLSESANFCRLRQKAAVRHVLISSLVSAANMAETHRPLNSATHLDSLMYPVHLSAYRSPALPRHRLQSDRG